MSIIEGVSISKVQRFSKNAYKGKLKKVDGGRDGWALGSHSIVGRVGNRN